MNSFDHTTLADFLNFEFVRRKSKNESYSLRAFARDLTLSPSHLSEVLKGKHGLTEKTADAVATQLRLKPIEKAYLKDLILANSSRSLKVRQLAKTRLEQVRSAQKFVPLKEEQFHVIADWYHAAIMELIQVEGFQSSAQWIASRLGIDMTEATAALGRLEKLGMIKKVGGKWKAQPEAYGAILDHPSAAVRKFQKQILSMSVQSLLQDASADREFVSTILALPKAQLPALKQELRKFMVEFCQKVENEPKDELYHLSLQLCPVRPRRTSYSQS